MQRNESRKIALCGVLAALSVVVLLLGNLLQIGTYCAPMLASFLLIPVLEEYGAKYALLLYATVSLLGTMLAPDKELALFYALVLGYYPVLRQRMDAIRSPVWRWCAKFAVFNGAVALLYLLLLFVLAPPQLLADFAQSSTLLLAVLLVAGNISFWLCDRALDSITRLYRATLHKKWKRMF